MPSVVGPGPATCLPPRALNSSDRSLAVTRLPPDTRLSPSLPLHSLKCRQNSDCYHFANIQRQTGTRRGFHNQHIEGLHWFEGWFSIFRSFYSHTRKLWFLLLIWCGVMWGWSEQIRNHISLIIITIIAIDPWMGDRLSSSSKSFYRWGIIGNYWYGTVVADIGWWDAGLTWPGQWTQDTHIHSTDEHNIL